MSKLIEKAKQKKAAYKPSKQAPPRRGFTLIELLTAVALIGLLTGLAIPAFSTYARRQNLAHAAKQLKTDINAAKNQAISGVDGLRWGIHLTRYSPTYQIFGVTGSGSAGFAYDNRTSTSFKSLPSNVTVSTIWVGGVSRSLANILFDRLNGTVSMRWDNGSDMPGNDDIRIRLDLSGTTRDVRVDSGGKVYEE